MFDLNTGKFVKLNHIIFIPIRRVVNAKFVITLWNGITHVTHLDFLSLVDKLDKIKNDSKWKKMYFETN